MVSAPCKDCKDREVGCHSKCNRYLKFKEELKVIKEKEREDFMIYEYYSYSRARRGVKRK